VEADVRLTSTVSYNSGEIEGAEDETFEDYYGRKEWADMVISRWDDFLHDVYRECDQQSHFRNPNLIIILSPECL